MLISVLCTGFYFFFSGRPQYGYIDLQIKPTVRSLRISKYSREYMIRGVFFWVGVPGAAGRF